MTMPDSSLLHYYPMGNRMLGSLVDGPNIGTESISIPVDEKEGHPKMYLLGVTVTILAAGAFVAANIIAFPCAGPISLLALGILSGVTYGIINDQLACRQCIQYFTIGHTSIHQRLLKTDDPTLNGIVWGIHATWVLGAIAGVAMAGVALVTGLVVCKILPFLIPAIAIGIGLTCLYAHIQAKKEEEKWQRPENRDSLNSRFKNYIILPKFGFHPVNLNNIPEDKRAAYLGVGKRNAIGYKAMPALGCVGLIGIIALGILL